MSMYNATVLTSQGTWQVRQYPLSLKGMFAGNTQSDSTELGEQPYHALLSSPV